VAEEQPQGFIPNISGFGCCLEYEAGSQERNKDKQIEKSLVKASLDMPPFAKTMQSGTKATRRAAEADHHRSLARYVFNILSPFGGFARPKPARKQLPPSPYSVPGRRKNRLQTGSWVPAAVDFRASGRCG